MNNEKFEEYSARARSDPEFRARLRAEPGAVLAECGLPVEPGVELKLVEDTGDVFHFVLPPELNTQLSDSSMAAVSGGVCFGLIPGRPRLFG